MATIHDYSFGHIVVDEQEHDRDLVILPDRVVANWWRKDGHRLSLVDLSDVESELPDHLIVGTGAYERMRPDPEALVELERRGIAVEVMDTAGAVARYRELDPARTAAALHLTC
jgi:hypothetical protein